MINLLIGFLIILIIELIIGFTFFKVFENPQTRRVLLTIFLLSLFITLIPIFYFEIFSTDSFSLKDSWRQVEQSGQKNSRFEYIDGEGLYVYKYDSRRKISGSVPECAPSGKITRLNPDRIEITTEPIVTLPAFPSGVRDQITFNMYYSSKPGAFASSSFVLNDSKGYLWCVEDSVGMGFIMTHLRFALYFYAYFLFVSCLIFFSIIVFILLIIEKIKQRKSYQGISS